jgi:hypothetical protein
MQHSNAVLVAAKVADAAHVQKSVVNTHSMDMPARCSSSRDAGSSQAMLISSLVVTDMSRLMSSCYDERSGKGEKVNMDVRPPIHWKSGAGD